MVKFSIQINYITWQKNPLLGDTCRFCWKKNMIEEKNDFHSSLYVSQKIILYIYSLQSYLHAQLNIFTSIKKSIWMNYCFKFIKKLYQLSKLLILKNHQDFIKFYNLIISFNFSLNIYSVLVKKILKYVWVC